MATVPQRIKINSLASRPLALTLALILSVGFVLRVVAAVVVQWYAQRIGQPCLFGDTLIYWELARTIREGLPFEVNQTGIPHFALRTPGYPIFLAACQSLFGLRYLPVRLVQASMGMVAVLILYRLVGNVAPASKAKVWTTAMVAGTLAAVEPYGIGLGVLILSEGPFIPLMLASLWGLAVLWVRDEPLRHPVLIALATGLANGAAILIRPSWALIVPCLLGAWVISTRIHRRADLSKQESHAYIPATHEDVSMAPARPFIEVKSYDRRNALLVAFATALVLMPWWVRNARVFGRFVPTALWVGASLYDGISPSATGASDMRFLDERGIVELDEEAQDAELKRRSIDFAMAHPARVIELAMIKAGRFWSPWPNAETLRSPLAAWLSAMISIPLFGLVAVGIWDRRKDGRALVLLAGPLAYFLVLHIVFVSSIRYRIPGMLPALGLAAIGWERLRTFVTSRHISAGRRPRRV